MSKSKQGGPVHSPISHTMLSRHQRLRLKFWATLSIPAEESVTLDEYLSFIGLCIKNVFIYDDEKEQDYESLYCPKILSRNFLTKGALNSNKVIKYQFLLLIISLMKKNLSLSEEKLNLMRPILKRTLPDLQVFLTIYKRLLSSQNSNESFILMMLILKSVHYYLILLPKSNLNSNVDYLSFFGGIEEIIKRPPFLLNLQLELAQKTMNITYLSSFSNEERENWIKRIIRLYFDTERARNFCIESLYKLNFCDDRTEIEICLLSLESFMAVSSINDRIPLLEEFILYFSSLMMEMINSPIIDQRKGLPLLLYCLLKSEDTISNNLLRVAIHFITNSLGHYNGLDFSISLIKSSLTTCENKLALPIVGLHLELYETSQLVDIFSKSFSLRNSHTVLSVLTRKLEQHIKSPSEKTLQKILTSLKLLVNCVKKENMDEYDKIRNYLLGNHQMKRLFLQLFQLEYSVCQASCYDLFEALFSPSLCIGQNEMNEYMNMLSDSLRTFLCEDSSFETNHFFPLFILKTLNESQLLSVLNFVNIKWSLSSFSKLLSVLELLDLDISTQKSIYKRFIGNNNLVQIIFYSWIHVKEDDVDILAKAVKILSMYYQESVTLDDALYKNILAFLKDKKLIDYKDIALLEYLFSYCSTRDFIENMMLEKVFFQIFILLLQSLEYENNQLHSLLEFTLNLLHSIKRLLMNSYHIDFSPDFKNHVHCFVSKIYQNLINIESFKYQQTAKDLIFICYEMNPQLDLSLLLHHIASDMILLQTYASLFTKTSSGVNMYCNFFSSLLLTHSAEFWNDMQAFTLLVDHINHYSYIKNVSLSLKVQEHLAKNLSKLLSLDFADVANIKGMIILLHMSADEFLKMVDCPMLPGWLWNKIIFMKVVHMSDIFIHLYFESLIKATPLTLEFISVEFLESLIQQYSAKMTTLDMSILHLFMVIEKHKTRALLYPRWIAKLIFNVPTTKVLETADFPLQSFLTIFDKKCLKESWLYFPVSRISYEEEKTEPESDYRNMNLYDPLFLCYWIFHALKAVRNKGEEKEACLFLSHFVNHYFLSILFLGLSSRSFYVRLASYLSLDLFMDLFEKYYYQSFYSNYNQIKWLLQSFTCSISADDRKNVKQQSCMMMYFTSQVLGVICKPSHPLYIEMNRFLLQRPSFELSDLLLFFNLFDSAENEKASKAFILETFIYGYKDEDDLQLLQKRFVFSHILTYISSKASLMNESLSVLALKALLAFCKVEASGKLLEEKYGLLSTLKITMLHYARREKERMEAATTFIQILFWMLKSHDKSLQWCNLELKTEYSYVVFIQNYFTMTLKESITIEMMSIRSAFEIFMSSFPRFTNDLVHC